MSGQGCAPMEAGTKSHPQVISGNPSPLCTLDGTKGSASDLNSVLDKRVPLLYVRPRVLGSHTSNSSVMWSSFVSIEAGTEAQTRAVIHQDALIVAGCARI